MTTTKPKTIAQKTEELNELMRWFDSDAFELEKALDVFGQAEKLADEIEHDLAALKNTITAAKVKFNEAE